jgi:Uma2 family endonuclease
MSRTLHGRLRGTKCQSFGMDMGVATVGDTVRDPDGVVTCSPMAGSSRLAPNPVAVFEVVGPTSGRMDRIVKLHEYAAVASIRRYVIVESASAGQTVNMRQAAGQLWTAASATADETPMLSEIGVEIPVAELYEGVEFGTLGTIPA